MEYKYLLGSKMLKLDNCRDEDWRIFIDAPAHTITDPDYRSIPFTAKRVENFMTKSTKDHPYRALFMYQLSREFHPEADYLFKHFSVFEHKEMWIIHLKNFINSEAAEQKIAGREILPKIFYHILYQYNMIIEGVHFISDEAKVNVQKIHDLEMPSSYFYELRELINSL